MYILHFYPGNASLLPHILLHEIGAPHELRLVDRAVDAQHSPAYRALNPHGRIPVLQDGELVLYETAAIALHLADAHPDAGLAPPLEHPLRPAYYKWMVHLTNTPQTEFRTWFYPEQHVDDPAAAPIVKRTAGARLDGMFDRITEQLGAGPWLLGERYSAADAFLFMLVRWGRAMLRPPRTLPALGAFADRMLARPAVVAAFRAEGLVAPYI